MIGVQTIGEPAKQSWSGGADAWRESAHRPPASEQLAMGLHGRPIASSLPEQDRIIGVVMHLWWLALVLPPGPLAVGLPIALWLWRRKESAWLDDHGREVLNFAISQVILTVVLLISLIGCLLLPVLWIVGIVGFIRGGIAAGRGEYFRYPMTFRFLQPRL